MIYADVIRDLGDRCSSFEGRFLRRVECLQEHVVGSLARFAESKEASFMEDPARISQTARWGPSRLSPVSNEFRRGVAVTFISDNDRERGQSGPGVVRDQFSALRPFGGVAARLTTISA